MEKWRNRETQFPEKSVPISFENLLIFLVTSTEMTNNSLIDIITQSIDNVKITIVCLKIPRYQGVV